MSTAAAAGISSLCSAALLSVLLFFSSTAEAQSIAATPTRADAPAPEIGFTAAPTPAGLDCTDAMLNLSACLTYVEDGSNLTVPDTGCCAGLSGLINNQPVCLCKLLSSSDIYGVKMDTAKAFTLPTVCRVQAPPVSLCSVFGIPVPSPTGPSMAPIPSSGASEVPGSSPPTRSRMPTSPPSGGSRLTSTSAAAFLVVLPVLSTIV